jgi:hypothetical protein
MNVWLDKPRRHSDDRHKASELTTMRSTLYNFGEILDLSYVQTVLPYRLDDRTSAARNFHIKASRV